jgi:hypothetical protein
VAWFKRLWFPLAVCTGLSLCGLLFLIINPYRLLANFYNQPTPPSRSFNSADWPRKPYTEKQLPIRQAMTDSILKDFRRRMTRKEIEAKLGTPDRIESYPQITNGLKQVLEIAKGDIAISYIVLQDFASGPFSLCFVLDKSSRLKKAFYRWG